MASFLFRQLFEKESSTYTYLLADEESREAIIIDPVLETVERDLQLLRELDLGLVYAIETHVHADHVTGNWALTRETGAKSVLSRSADVGADVLLEDGDEIRFGEFVLQALATPGHTQGCMSYYFREGRSVFTGDLLLIRGTGRTDFQGGSSETMFASIREKVFSLPPETLIYPGHDYTGRLVSSVKEEKEYNPRVGLSKTVPEFVEIMKNLNLAHPKKIKVAVPANLKLGRLASD